jgi:hypothetical protein
MHGRVLHGEQYAGLEMTSPDLVMHIRSGVTPALYR